MRIDYVLAGIVVAILIILALQFLPDDDAAPPPEIQAPSQAPPPSDPEPVPSAVTDVPPQEAVAPTVVPEPLAPPLPELHESDALVRTEVGDWGLPDTVVQRDDLLARLAVVMANSARGDVPRRQVAFLTPAERFAVIKDGERIYVDPSTYGRYDRYLDTLEAIPAAELAEFMRRFDPLLGEALVLLGETSSPPELLQAAVERLARLPTLPDRVELVQPDVMYAYADPDLEALPEFEKQLLRMGSRNVERLQRYAVAFMAAYRNR